MTNKLSNNVLGIDTAQAETVIGLNDDVVNWVSDRNQSKELLPAIDKLIRSQKLTPQKLRGVVVNIGPGSFTGLRVGLTVANGFGYGLKIPLVGMSEFDVIRLFFPKVDLIILDAKRDELFVEVKNQAPKLIPVAKLGGLIKRGMSVYVEPSLALTLHSQLSKAGTIYLGEIPRVERMTRMLNIAGQSSFARELRTGKQVSPTSPRLRRICDGLGKKRKFVPIFPLYLRGANITKAKK